MDVRVDEARHEHQVANVAVVVGRHAEALELGVVVLGQLLVRAQVGGQGILW